MDVAAISLRAAEISTEPGFGAPGLWLTFYLLADTAMLNEAGECLARLGALNLDDAGGGFMYPKLPVQANPSAIVALVMQVCEIASASQVQVLGADVDTSPDVSASLSKQLVSF